MNTLFLFIIFSCFIVLQAQAKNINPPFLYSEDQSIEKDDPLSKIFLGNDISNNKWFMNPPTRLELFIFSLNQYHQKVVKEARLKHNMKEFFELKNPKSWLDSTDFEVESSASYSKKLGGFVLSVKISNLGKPKKPIKEAMEELLALINISGLYHLDGDYVTKKIFNSFSTISIQNLQNENKISNIVKDKYIITGELECSYEDKKSTSINPIHNYYSLVGIKEAKVKEIQYIKSSYQLVTKKMNLDN